MPRKRQQPPNVDASFDIAESIFCSLPPPKKITSKNHEKTAKVKKKLLNTETTNSASAENPTESSNLQGRNVKTKSLNSKFNSIHTSATKPSSSVKNSQKKQDSVDNQQTSNSRETSSEESDEDIPLFRRIQMKNVERRNGALSGFRNDIKTSIVKNHVKSPEKNIRALDKQTGEDPSHQMPLPKHDLPMPNASHSKRVKFNSHESSKAKHNAKNSRIKSTNNKNHSTSANRYLFVERVQEEPIRSSCMFAKQKNSDKSQAPQSSTSRVDADTHTAKEVRHRQKSCAIASTSSGGHASDPGPSKTSKVKTKKKPSPPGNTVRNCKSNAIHQHIKDIFGSDSESENEIEEMGEQAYARYAGRTFLSSGSHAKSTKKPRNNLVLSDDSSDTEPDVSLLKTGSKGKSKSGRGQVKESKNNSSDTEPDVSVLGARPKGKKKASRAKAARPKTDSSDTEPDVSLLGRRSEEKKRSKRAKEENQSRRSVTSVNSDDSDVEMMSTSETPEGRSPVFNRMGDDRLQQRSSSPVFQRSPGRRVGGRRPVSLRNPSSSDPEGSRPSRRRKKKVRSDVDNNSDSDVVPIEDEVEEINHRRRGQERLPSVSEVTSSHRIRLSGSISGRSDLGTKVNVEHLVSVSSTSDVSTPQRPSCQQQDVTSPSRGHGIRGERIRSGRSWRITNTPPSSERRRQRQLESDEQLARDLASGRVTTPRSGNKTDKGSSTGRRRRNRQVADDEALARELASGNISTPREEGPASQQIDDDEALARRLQVRGPLLYLI